MFLTGITDFTSILSGFFLSIILGLCSCVLSYYNMFASISQTANSAPSVSKRPLNLLVCISLIIFILCFQPYHRTQVFFSIYFSHHFFYFFFTFTYFCPRILTLGISSFPHCFCLFLLYLLVYLIWCFIKIFSDLFIFG